MLHICRIILLSWAVSLDYSNAETRDPPSILLLGDSQTARHLGKAFIQEFHDYKVTYYGKSGATHIDYLLSQKVKKTLSSLSCAKMIYVQLGDNGVPNKTSSIKKFVQVLQTKCPGAKIYWGGPVKAVKPTRSSYYVTVTNRKSIRYLPRLNSIRRVWRDRLSRGLRSTGVVFVDNYKLQEAQPLESPFSDSRGGDGVHLTLRSARALAKLVRGIIETKD